MQLPLLPSSSALKLTPRSHFLSLSRISKKSSAKLLKSGRMRLESTCPLPKNVWKKLNWSANENPRKNVRKKNVELLNCSQDWALPERSDRCRLTRSRTRHEATTKWSSRELSPAPKPSKVSLTQKRSNLKSDLRKLLHSEVLKWLRSNKLLPSSPSLKDRVKVHPNLAMLDLQS